MPGYKQTTRLLAASIIGGPWESGPLSRRIHHAISLKGLNSERLALDLVHRFGEGRTPSVKELASAIAANKHFEKCFMASEGQAEWLRMGVEPAQMNPPKGDLATLPLPALATSRDVCEWLEIDQPALEWFADTRKRQPHVRDERLLHYTYLWKRRRGKSPRLIESPKGKLKKFQRKILSEILNKIPPHEAAHGFARNRSIITHALLHTEKECVASFDLKDFFHAVPPARIASLFRALGYPHEVSRILSGLCLHAPDAHYLGSPLTNLPFPVQKKILSPHLPQGAPTSPALANLCAFRLDVRLQSLAQSMDLTYSRYADDLTFSGGKDLKKQFSYLRGTLSEIAAQQGFKLNPEKTRLMTQAQRQVVTGVVVNKRPNISRAEYDRLKATLYQCAEGEEKDALLKQSLRGKVEFVRTLNPQRGEKLLRLWEKIT
ncbi:MAG: RNA-directed DNA polymerase [Alphaproteobacteria bacterium]|nr:RNA-directed DNA polymerase [Alphaproteobacteria bacterium]